MSPFELNQRITLQRRAEGKDSSGALVQGWENVITVGDGKIWAKVDDMTGRQYVAARATENAVVTKIRIRLRDGVAEKMRVLHGANVYDIEATLRVDGRWLDMMCARGVNDG